MCSSNILKILIGDMPLLFFFCNKIWKTVYHFYLLACQYANVCKIMYRCHEYGDMELAANFTPNEYKFIDNFYGSKGSAIYLGLLCFQCQLVA
jgi:hypothetical protein